MSRIGKKPVAVPSGVKVSVDGQDVTIEGPKGKLQTPIPPGIAFEQKLGEPVDLSLAFTDEDGKAVTLADYFRQTGQGDEARRLLWDPLALAQEAVDHAYANGVIVNASEADEAAAREQTKATREKLRQMLRRGMKHYNAGYAAATRKRSLKIHFHMPPARSLVRGSLTQATLR